MQSPDLLRLTPVRASHDSIQSGFQLLWRRLSVAGSGHQMEEGRRWMIVPASRSRARAAKLVAIVCPVQRRASAGAGRIFGFPRRVHRLNLKSFPRDIGVPRSGLIPSNSMRHRCLSYGGGRRGGGLGKQGFQVCRLDMNRGARHPSLRLRLARTRRSAIRSRAAMLRLGGSRSIAESRCRGEGLGAGRSPWCRRIRARRAGRRGTCGAPV
jgi:hypothetical protein